MTLRVDVYYSYRSPYSYLATARMRKLSETYDLEFDVRVVLPLAVRSPEFFDKVNPLWPPYLMMDTRRLAGFLRVPFRWPRPDPVVMDMKTLSIPAEQPYIWPISRLGVVAQEQGRGCAFTCEVTRMMWGGEVDDWHEGCHLAQAAECAGLDLATMLATVEDETERIDAAIDTNQAALEAAGHWGVPTFVFEGEPIFGQDRMDLLVWRLEESGVRRR
ncbi:MAG: DsbA family protein [Acidobacteriota bacterium]|nr:DsbA family protein [Acidobacteriota bacterium]